ncbi:hypothetical protein FN976_28660, partial [Caenimonas sedimenti]
MRISIDIDIDSDVLIDTRDVQAVQDALPALLAATVALGRFEPKLVRLMVANPTPSIEDVRAIQQEAAMLRDGTQWLNADRVTKLATIAADRPAPEVSRWKRERKIFAIRFGGIEYFPRYGFGPGFRPLREMTTILRALPHADDLELARWFE